MHSTQCDTTQDMQRINSNRLSNATHTQSTALEQIGPGKNHTEVCAYVEAQNVHASWMASLQTNSECNVYGRIHCV